MKEKRDRAVRYWKDRVIQEFLPPIDTKKRTELNERVTKMKENSNSKTEMKK
jgi:trimethylamine:corrinoid methyltransferase-like protein